MSDVVVLHAVLTKALDAARAEWLMARLPYARRLELERRDAAAQAASLLATELVLEAVARLRGEPPDISRLRFPQQRKPYLEDGSWFSVSHSSKRVVVAASDRCDVGIDVEDTGGPAGPAELDRWTAIEATLKAAGCGLRQARDVRLACDLSTGEVSGQLVHLRRIVIAPDCIARLATRQPVHAVTVAEWGEAAAGG
jgi:phosphopantetheinyl transferase